jgi:ABC-type phosphonate transport system ATPase subunit
VGSVGSESLGVKQRVQVVRGLTAGERESVILQKTGGLDISYQRGE